MIYYTSDLKEIEFNPNEKPIGCGEQSYIYKFDEDKCIKTYIEGMPTIRPEIFNLFKELSLVGYSKLHYLLYSEPELQKVAAYISNYYNSDANNILFMPTDYTIHNFEMLYKAMRILSENQVLVKDLVPKNVILGNNGITVVDYDSYVKTTRSIEELLKLNSRNLVRLFRTLYKDAFENLSLNIKNNKNLNNYIDHLFSNSEEPVKTLCRKINKTRRPIDSLYDRC